MVNRHGVTSCGRRRKGTLIRAKVSKEFLFMSLGQDFSGAISGTRRRKVDILRRGLISSEEIATALENTSCFEECQL